MKLSIFVPVYNEEPTVRLLLEKVAAVDLTPLRLTKEIIVVNDGSTDRTAAQVRAFLADHPDEPVRLIELSGNHGKGYAVRQALNTATGELCVVQDADLEYDPADWSELLAPLAAGEAPVVFGSRGLPLGADQSRRRFYQIGLVIAHFFIRLLYGYRFTDAATCYKAMGTELMRRLDLKHRRFSWDMELGCKLLNRGVPILERPISYRPRYKSEGKKIRWRDFVSSMWAIFHTRFFDRGAREFRLPT
ncbi:MAG: glycosyltransferase family 2 protein [Candidatus Lernaella stagnicola]|nr:glycosyltransferase family 2 protein [Candidatus Lernaella stagnicola]